MVFVGFGRCGSEAFVIGSCFCFNPFFVRDFVFAVGQLG